MGKPFPFLSELHCVVFPPQSEDIRVGDEHSTSSIQLPLEAVLSLDPVLRIREVTWFVFHYLFLISADLILFFIFNHTEKYAHLKYKNNSIFIFLWK